MKIQLNDIYKHEFSFSQSDIVKFADVTGDKNPVHLDANYAATTMFKVPIMHGMLGASLFSKVFGTLFPGEVTIYLKQSLAFMKPMFVDTAYEAVFTVKEINNYIKLKPNLTNFEKIKTFEVIKETFNQENGLLSQTGKTKRNKIFDKYNDIISKMFSDKK